MIRAASEAAAKSLEQLILHQDARIIAALRKGDDIPLEAENEALRLRRLLNDVRARERELLNGPGYKRASVSHTHLNQDTEKSRVPRKTGL
jgi:hypothetical protein